MLHALPDEVGDDEDAEYYGRVSDDVAVMGDSRDECLFVDCLVAGNANAYENGVPYGSTDACEE